MVEACSRCGRQPPDEARFCPECGAPLAATDSNDARDQRVSDVLRAFVSGPVADRLLEDALVEDRRTVTAVFADLSGFTALAGSMSPTDLAQVIDPVVGGLTRIVDRYGGAVEKFAGDAILAFFGAPIAHENDAERALLAALEMHEQLPMLSSHPAAQTLTLHVGVNTGEVYARMVGSQARLDYAVLGEAVVLAQRLESLAPTGQTYVGAETAALVGDAFLFEDLGALTVKGRDEGVPAVRLLGRALSPRATRRRTTALVGRDAELERLDVLLEGAGAGRGAVVLLEGEAGLGKSLLVEAVRDRADLAQVPALVLRAMSHGSLIPFHAVAEAVRAHYPAEDPDDPVLRVLTGAEASPADDLPVEPEALRAEVVRRSAGWLAGLRRPAGLLLVAEDLHWADGGTIDVLAQVARVASESGLLLLVTSRPGTQALAELGNAAGDATETLSLAAFGPEQLATSLAHELGAPPDQRVVDLLAARTDGNPLFAAELADAMADQGTLVLRDGRWRLSPQAEHADLPRSVGALFGARVDALPPLLAETLWAAAVVGMEPEPALVGRTLDLPDAVADERLERLLALGLLARGRGPRVFRHALLRDAVLERLAPDRARSLHLRAAEAVAQAAAPGSATSARIGQHLFEGGALRLALPYLLDVAGASTALFAHDDAIPALRMAVRSAELDPPDDRIAGLLLDLGVSLESVGDYGAAEAAFEDATVWAERLDEPQLLVDAWTGRGAVRRRDGAYAEALQLLEDGLAVVGTSAADVRSLLLERARTLELLGRLDEAWTATHEGLRQRPPYGEPDLVEARLLLQRAGMHMAAGRLLEAKVDLRSALSLFEAFESPVGAVGGLTLLGDVYVRGEEYGLADDTFRRAHAEAVRIGRVEDAAGVLNNLGWMAIHLEDWAQAQSAFAGAGEQFAEVGHLAGMATCHANEAYAVWKLGDLELSGRLVEQAMAEADSIGRVSVQADARLTAGLIARDLGDGERARALAEEASTLATQAGEDDLAAQAEELLSELSASPL